MKSAEFIKYRAARLHIPKFVLELLIESLGVEDASLIIHQAIKVPPLLVLGVDRGGAFRVLHNDFEVLFREVDFVLVMPLSKFQVTLGAQ
jgi:hypothetical protein